MTLVATTCLGENTVPMLRDLVDELSRAGVDVAFDDQLSASERLELFVGGNADIAWACGLLTVEQLASGLDMEIVASPVFDGESAPVYRSVIAVRADDESTTITDTFSGRVAVNEFGSWSGCRGFDRWLRLSGHRLDDYRTTIVTGSHQRSIEAVRDGVADVAAIDHTIWSAQAAREVAALRVLTITDDWPAPPISLSRRASHLDTLIIGAKAMIPFEASAADRYETMLMRP